MTIKGISDGTYIKPETKLKVGQEVIIIPVDISSKKDEAKTQTVNKLFGSVKSDMSLSDIKEERLKKYEITS